MADDKLVEAAVAIGQLKKDKRNPHGKYDYISEEAVKTAVHREITSRGILPDRFVTDIVADAMVDQKQGKANLVKVKVSIDIDGKHWEGLGAGIDYGDKALMKAQTAAVREAWKNGFVIASGEPNDPEASPEDGPRQQARPAQGRQQTTSGSGTGDKSEAARVTVPFGRAKGEALGDQSAEELEWFAHTYNGKNEELRQAARTLLKETGSGDGEDEDPGPDDSDIPF